jgi:hypothetical protein
MGTMLQNMANTVKDIVPLKMLLLLFYSIINFPNSGKMPWETLLLKYGKEGINNVVVPCKIKRDIAWLSTVVIKKLV